MKLKRYARLVTPGEVTELFLVTRERRDYVIRVVQTSSLSIGVEPMDFDLLLENHLRGVYDNSVYTLDTTALDPARKRKMLAAFESPFVGLDFDTVHGDRAEVDSFHALLVKQLRRWKGSGSFLAVTRHRYWPTFHAQVVKALGGPVRLYRGVHGANAATLDGALTVRPYSSWTTDEPTARDIAFRSMAGSHRNTEWIVARATIPAEDIAFAPVLLPDYIEPRVLLDEFTRESEYVVHAPSQQVPVKVSRKSRSKVMRRRTNPGIGSGADLASRLKF